MITWRKRFAAHHRREPFSLVLQGRIDDSVIGHAQNALKYSDDVIVSTWFTDTYSELALHETLRELGVRVVLSRDPGSFLSYEEAGIKKTLNVNRQLRGISAGARVARYRYTIKARADLSINYAAFFARWMSSGRRFASLNITSVAPRRLFSPPFLFHISDWCVGAETVDFRNQYQKEIDESTLNRSVTYEMNGARWNVRLSAEQILACILTGENELIEGQNQLLLDDYSDIDWSRDRRIKSKFANIDRDGLAFFSSKYKARATRWIMHRDLLFRDDRILTMRMEQLAVHLLARTLSLIRRYRDN